MLGVAVLQEAVQALSVRNLRVWDTLLDLLVDAAAGGIPIVVTAWFRRKRITGLAGK